MNQYGPISGAGAGVYFVTSLRSKAKQSRALSVALCVDLSIQVVYE